ncbi:MAG: bifunctional serine/threonine-protein kinase/formylglycine-generating enzyme family protein, partial [Myxococcota bacterium]
VPVALKVLHPHLTSQPDWADRFLAEARLLASIRHPGIPAVHDLDRLASGAPFYTMDEVVGQPLWRALGGLARPRRLDLVLRTAVIVAHAHTLGVVHRDLSATNVLVTADGEVWVVDWGLAGRVADQKGLEPTGGSTRTVGTPGYSPPEQRSGAAPDPRMDVFALGGLLGLALCDAPPPARPAHDEEPELVHLFAACRAPEPPGRPADANEIVSRLRDWIDGAARRERSRAATVDADLHARRAVTLDDRAAQVRQRAAERMIGLRPYTPETEKVDGWALEDRAAEIEGLAEQERVYAEQKLLLAIREDPAEDRPHEQLARRWMEQFDEAERTGDRRARVRFSTLVRSWRDGRYGRCLDAPGELSLDSDPTGAEVSCERFTERDRRLLAEPLGCLGHTPLQCRMEPGSYRLRLRAAGHLDVRLPVVVERGATWCHLGPDGTSQPVWLPPLGAVEHDECYVPAGWFWRGGDPLAPDGLPRRQVFVGGFAIGRFPVTVEAYVASLNALMAAGRTDEALSRVPQESDGVSGATRRVFKLGGDGRFEVTGDVWHARWRRDWPVTLVDWWDATAFASRASRRLPHDHEWEKAARGVDGRLYAWGDYFDATRANMSHSRPTAPEPSAVDRFPIDESVYGVRGVTGNVRDWCSNAYQQPGPASERIDPLEDPSGAEYRVIRGGSWSSAAMMCRLTTRFAAHPATRLTAVGFRLARSVGP